MAPEQALGREIDRSADVWAAGVVLYELLAGCVPFTGASFVELAMQIREKAPKDFPNKTPRGERIPPWLAAVALKCLEKKPADRYRSMAALAEALAAKGEDRKRGLPRKLIAVVAGLVAGVALVFLGVRFDVPAQARAALDRARATLHAVSDRATSLLPPPAEERRAPPPPSPAPAQASTPAKKAAAPAPTAREAEAPQAKAPARATAPAPAPRPATVELSLRSSPTGARVVRLDTGARLGRTPLRLNVPRKAATVWIQMTLDGYQPIKFTVDLRRDNSANVTFQGARKTTRRR
jgi:serine/threonine-protein kinase